MSILSPKLSIDVKRVFFRVKAELPPYKTSRHRTLAVTPSPKNCPDWPGAGRCGQSAVRVVLICGEGVKAGRRWGRQAPLFCRGLCLSVRTAPNCSLSAEDVGHKSIQNRSKSHIIPPVVSDKRLQTIHGVASLLSRYNIYGAVVIKSVRKFCEVPSSHDKYHQPPCRFISGLTSR